MVFFFRNTTIAHLISKWGDSVYDTNHAKWRRLAFWIHLNPPSFPSSTHESFCNQLSFNIVKSFNEPDSVTSNMNNIPFYYTWCLDIWDSWFKILKCRWRSKWKVRSMFYYYFSFETDGKFEIIMINMICASHLTVWSNLGNIYLFLRASPVILREYFEHFRIAYFINTPLKLNKCQSDWESTMSSSCKKLIWAF